MLWNKLHYQMSTLLNGSCTQMLISILGLFIGISGDLSFIRFCRLNVRYIYVYRCANFFSWNRAMGFPTEFFPVLFAIPRMAGYLSHWRESLDDPDTKIMRPAQVYFLSRYPLNFGGIFVLLSMSSTKKRTFSP